MNPLIMHHKEGDYLTSIVFWLGFISPFVGIATAWLNIGNAFTNIITSIMIMFGLLMLWGVRQFV